MNAKICEIYRTVIGEGRFMGKACTLIRFAGCDLYCPYCDTKYAITQKNSKTISLTEMKEIISESSPNLVLITGGEPLLQYKFVNRMIISNPEHKFVLETNGGQLLKKIDYWNCHISMDIKAPYCLNGNEKSYYEAVEKNIRLLDRDDDIKFIIDKKTDWDWTLEKIDEVVSIFSERYYFPRIYISHTENFPFDKLWKLYIETSNLHKNNIYIQTQLHKIAFKNGTKEREIGKIV
ncbi:MAG: 7-carboxy-7-deazaguanine synthase QueE [Candidatus Heimdallarchaeaceae archaeon]